jgi:preprotein translocase SecE subunit
MAETAGQQPKRRVKNPETFRERALKATESSEQPGTGRRLRQAGGKVANPVVGPISRAWRKLFSVQPFKFIAKIARWIGLVVFPPYFRNSWRELRLVTWPTWKQSRQLTFAVLIFAVIFGAIVALVDYGLDKVFRNILLK